MSLLKILRIQPYSTVRNEQAQGFLRQFKQKLERGEFSDADIALVKASDEQRERMIFTVADAEDGVDLAAAWASAYPKSAFANVLLGASLIVSGWKIRGGNYAEDVDDSAWAPFLKSLKSAEEPLLRACELNPQLSEPYAWLIHAGLGQDIERETLDQWFRAGVERHPLHWPTHYKFFNVVTEKWGGSHEEMFLFARHRSQKAPTGHLLHCLIPAAFNDYFLALRADIGVSQARSKLKQKTHAKEVGRALYTWLNATPENIEQKIQQTTGGFADYGLNQFAVALYLCGAYKEAKLVIAALHSEIDVLPWAWIGQSVKERLNPAFVHDRVCRELGISLQ